MVSHIMDHQIEAGLPDDRALFGEAEGLAVRDIPADQRPQYMRHVIDRAGQEYRHDFWTGGVQPDGGKWKEEPVSMNGDEWKAGSSGDVCIVSSTDLPGLSGDVRYALIFYDNKSPGNGNDEEIDIGVIVYGHGAVRFNRSMRLSLPDGYDHMRLLSASSRFCDSIKTRMPLYFGAKGL
jgi:hypothetical protein